MDVHHILPQIDITDVSEDQGSSINTSAPVTLPLPSPHRLAVPDDTPGPGSSSPVRGHHAFSALGHSFFSRSHASSSPVSPSSSSSPSPSPSPNASKSPSPHGEQWWSGRYDFAAKVIILGDYGVGKTSLLATLGRLEERSWCRCLAYRANEYVEMECCKSDKKVLIRIMDTGGQERFRSITSSYFRGAHGCLLLFNVTNEESFNNIINWFNDLHVYAPPDNICCLVVGIITNVARQRVVTAERAFRLAESLGLTYCETQVRDEQMVLWILTRLVNSVVISRARRQSLAITIMPNLQEHLQKKEKKRWKCCPS